MASVGRQTGLWLQPLDGAAPRLLSSGEGVGYPLWSPDSKSIAFFANGKLQRADLPAGAPFTIYEVDASMRGGGTWSNDGFILFGTMGTGLFKVPVSGGPPSRLATRDPFVMMPQVLPGGRFLYYTTPAPKARAWSPAHSINPVNAFHRFSDLLGSIQ